jgi:hypothetical protein
MAGKIEELFGAAVGISLVHERIHNGRSFVASYKTPDASPLADNGTLEFLVIVGSAPVHFSFQAGGNNDLEIVFFENVTVSGNGTSIPVVGLNRHRSQSPTVSIWRDPTITSDGDQVLNEFFSWSTGSPAPRENLEWILRSSTQYLARVINRAGATQPVSLVANWYQR